MSNLIAELNTWLRKDAGTRLLVFCLMTLPSNVFAEDALRILFIGNSYTNQIKTTVQDIVSQSPHNAAVLEFICPGGKTLDFHSKQSTTLDRIRGGRWDVVVLQDQSQNPAVFPERFLASSKRMHAVIRASGAVTAYYQTWGRRDGDSKNQERFGTYARMQMALSKAYKAAATRDTAILVPVGEAWQRTRQQNPDLGRSLYRKDGSHPSANGAYVAALCFYCCVLKGDLDDVRYSGDVDSKIAARLRQAVQGVVAK